MASILPQIQRIIRDPDITCTLGAGVQRTRTMRVHVVLKADAWGLNEPDYYLSDLRLPALYSSYPALPYPETDADGNLVAAFAAYDLDCRFYTVAVSTNATKSVITFEYQYQTVPAQPPGALPQQFRRDPSADNAPPGSGDIQCSFAYSHDEVEYPYRTDASFDANSTVFPGGSPQAQRAVNTAGERYDPLPTRKYAITTLTVSRLEAKHRPTFWWGYNYVKNRYVWNGHLPGVVLSFPPSVAPWQQFGGGLVYPVTYTFRWLNDANVPSGMKPVINKQTFWDDVILSYGLKEKSGNGLKDIKVGSMIAPSRVPWPLNAAGKAIDPPDSADPASTTYLKYLYRDFTPLNIKLPADES